MVDSSSTSESHSDAAVGAMSVSVESSMSESHSDEDPVVMSVSRSALVESSVTKESQSDELGDSIDCVDLDSRAPCVQAASSDDTSPPTERSPPTIAIRAC